MSPVRVLELRSVWGTGGGPDKTILTGTKLTDVSRFSVTVCYIRDARDRVFTIDTRARELGLDYVEIMERHSFDHRIWPALRRIVRDRQIDIVHAHDHKTDALTWALSRVDPVIPLSTAHGFAGRSRNERFYYAVEKRLLARFPRVIAVSQKIKAELVRTGSKPDRIVVINNGIDHRTFRRSEEAGRRVRQSLDLAADVPVIGAVGRLEDEKRFDLLIDAMQGLRRTHARATLIIVGEGTLRPMLEQKIAALGMGQAVRLVGHRSDVAALHSAFDVFVQSSEREGTPNCVLEAMALETPIVATAAGGTGELVTDGVHGLLVPIHDVPALESALDKTLRDRAAAATRVIAARRKVETDLSFDRRMRLVEEVYVKLMAAAGRAPLRESPQEVR
jgi:glycosyltransferase involved in cell wall biosynthesis